MNTPDILQPLDIGFARQGKVFDGGMELAAGFQYPLIDQVSLRWVFGQHKQTVCDQSALFSAFGNDLLQHHIAVAHRVFGPAQQVHDAVVGAILANHQVLHMLRHATAAIGPAPDISATFFRTGCQLTPMSGSR